MTLLWGLRQVMGRLVSSHNSQARKWCREKGKDVLLADIGLPMHKNRKEVKQRSERQLARSSSIGWLKWRARIFIGYGEGNSDKTS